MFFPQFKVDDENQQLKKENSKLKEEIEKLKTQLSQVITYIHTYTGFFTLNENVLQ